MPARFARLLAQAIGFAAGALAGYWLAYFLGVDLLRDPWSPRSVLAVAAVGLGGGIGIGAGRHWQQERSQRAPSRD